MEQYLAPAMEPDVSSFRRQSVISLQELRSDVMARYPGYQVEPSEPAPTKPTSLGLTNFQQTKPEKEANLPLYPSLEAWLTCQAQTLEGKDRYGRVIKPPLGQKTYPKLPSLKAERFEPSNAPSLLRVGQLPPEWHRLVSDQGRISPETVSFTRAEFGELQSSVSKILAVLSDLDWWVAEISNLAKDIQPHLSHDENLQLSDLATDICLWSEKRGMTLVPRYLPGHLNVLADHLSRRGQILKTEWSLNQTVADRIFRAWGRPFVDLFALGKNTKLAIYVSPIREEMSWKVDSLVQNWNGLYAYAYPPTSLIRACLNKVRTENVEIVLIAPGWPNQEWFLDLLDLVIDFPITLPPVQKLLKQTFSHHFHPHPSNLNLHAWEVIKGFHKERGFSEAVAQRLAISQRQS